MISVISLCTQRKICLRKGYILTLISCNQCLKICQHFSKIAQSHSWTRKMHNQLTLLDRTMFGRVVVGSIFILLAQPQLAEKYSGLRLNITCNGWNSSWRTSMLIGSGSCSGSLKIKIKIKRHKRPCPYYANTVATLHVVLDVSYLVFEVQKITELQRLFLRALLRTIDADLKLRVSTMKT